MNIRSFILACVFAVAALAAPATQDLKVLYVGGSIDWAGGDEPAIPRDPGPDDPRVGERMKSFEQMLRRHFTSVDVIHAKYYTQEKSAAYDVTVLDGTPPAMEPRRDIKDASGRILKVIPARYFSEDFDRPVLFIGELGERLGRRVGSKFDWYCLCLDAHALGLRAEHPIFRGPFPVKLTIEERPTPELAFDYEAAAGRVAPKTLPMWRVQTKGYMTDRGFRVGMVARPWGFEDSPEAEVISGGVSAKGLDAVAIGRHGNFFGWGFAASPAFLTDEAQTVLANAICYIAKFDGQGLIARKYDDRATLKDQAATFKYMATQKCYDDTIAQGRRHNAMMAGIKRDAEAKQAKGEKLTRIEQVSLQYRPSREQTHEEFLRSRFRDLYPRFGGDASAYVRYYDENLDYFVPDESGFGLRLDEDVKSLGLANSDHRLLAKCIELWEKGVDVENVRRVLERYTLLDYSTPGEWRRWYEKHKAQLFFTESGGFVFLVNSREPGVEGNDYARAEARIYRPVVTAATDDRNPVAASAAIVRRERGRRELVLKVNVHPGYHLYASVASGDPFIATTVEFELPAGYTAAGPMKLPNAEPIGTAGTAAYKDELVFAQEISGIGDGEAVVKLSYQCCDARICFPPVQQELRVKLNGSVAQSP